MSDQPFTQSPDGMAPQTQAWRDLVAAKTPGHPLLAQAGRHGGAGVNAATKHI